METSAGQGMVEAFRYVRDVYRNISRMLLSCDPLMEEKGFLTNPRWYSIWPKRTLELSPENISDTWLPYFVVRHYYNVDAPLELLTIGAVVWDNWDSHWPGFDTPLCLASRMLVPNSGPKEITALKDLMWISVIQMWDTTAKPDGEVRVLSWDSSHLPDRVRKEIPQYVHVRGGRILSVACPLLEVCDTDVIEKRLINPLLGRCLTELIPPSDEAEAVRWLRQAAEGGNPTCQVHFGLRHANGQGVPQDAAEAARWYRKAAEQGNPLGQLSLGGMYRDGRGLARDDTEAVLWFRKAAEQGNVDGQANLGWMYENGRGVGVNVTEAIVWYRRAAEQGLEYAKQSLKRLGIES
jgi:Sel1 repeat